MLLRRFCFCALCLLLFCGLPCHGSELSLRGVFVSTVSNLDFPSSPGLSSEEMKGELDSILQNARKAGLNSIFFQVRPCADALYPSSIFPYSRYLTGKQGQAPLDGFDPLAYLTEQAHEYGMEVHAWINPYRVTQGVQGETKEACLQTLAETHPARKDPSLVIFYNGELYFDPALPQVRQLVANGVQEILENYPVDGIHLDDYFYPGTDFGDNASYAQYGQGASLDDFRRSNVTLRKQTPRLSLEFPLLASGPTPPSWREAAAPPAPKAISPTMPTPAFGYRRGCWAISPPSSIGTVARRVRTSLLCSSGGKTRCRAPSASWCPPWRPTKPWAETPPLPGRAMRRSWARSIYCKTAAARD